MAIFTGVGGSGDSSDNSYVQEVTGQANAASASASSASASASAASASASAASASATSALNTELTSASFNTSDGVLTLTKQDGQTVTTDLDGRYADLTGATFTGQVYFNENARVPDDKQLFFGASGDLRIWHSSSNNSSYIGESGTGSLVIYGTDLYLQDSVAGGNRYLYGNSGAETTLYFNDDEKLSTTNTGVNFEGDITLTGTVDGVDIATLGANAITAHQDISGKANLSGATFTGDVTAKSKLIVNKQPVASDLLTTSRSIQDLASWGDYVATSSNYDLTAEKYRDAFDINQDNKFSSADSFALLLFVGDNYTSSEASTYQSLVNNPSNITSTFVQDVLDGDYDSLSTSAGVTIDMDASSLVSVEGNVTVDGNITVTGDISSVDDFGADNASFTGDVSLLDNGILKLGNDADLQVYHNPTNGTSYIQNASGDNLVIRSDSFLIKSVDNSKAIVTANEYGAVNLFHDGDIKFETRDDGIRVTGDIEVSGTVDGRDVATDGAKLDNIEASADVTDTANVTSAGALMDSEVTNLAQVKAFDSSDYATSTQGTTADNALPKAGGQMTGNITFSGTQTVDGRDLSVDGTKLDGIGKFSFGDPSNKPVQTTAPVTLITSDIPAAGTEVGQYVTARFSFKVRNATTATKKNFGYQIRSEMKSKNTTGVSLGTGTYVSSPSSFNAWYYVSGNKTHIISAGRGKVGTTSGGNNSGTLIGSYYDSANDRTYIRISKYPDYNTVYNNVEIFYSVDSFTSVNTWVVQNTFYNTRYVSLVGSASETKHITINDFFGRHSTATTFRIQVDNLSSVSGWDIDVYDLNGTVENAL